MKCNKNIKRGNIASLNVVMILFAGTLMFCIMGCGMSEKIAKSNSSGNEDDYFKLQMEELELDVDELTKYVLDENVIFFENAIEVEPVPGGFARYELYTNEEKFLWSYNEEKNDYFFFRSSEGELINEDEGRQLADSVINNIELKLSDNMAISDNIEIKYDEDMPYAIEFVYTLEYKNIDILGNIPINESVEYDGTWIEVVVDSKGIKCLNISNMRYVSEEILTFDAKEFITEDIIENISKTYCEKVMTIGMGNLSEITFVGEIKDVSIIYISSEENGEILWVPGYKVLYQYEFNNQEHLDRLIIDAFDGYVYNWMEIQ